MKTLDEVIACLDGCGHIDCDDCPYHYEDEKIDVDDCAQAYKDALHYLKEYQTLQFGYIKAMADLEDNPPLTWDELKTMIGQPVWVELTYPEGSYSHWGIIEGFPIVGYEFMDLRGFHQIDSFSVVAKEQGKTWQAYRKERK